MTIRLTWRRIVAAAAGLLLLGLAVAWSGAVNVAASSGHWAITNWFLHWVMENSVRTRAALTVPDEVSDPTGLVSAAGHFAGSCAACHGAPGMKPLAVMQAATPPAPDLSVNAAKWTDRQLYWILDHGVKFSGMPFWPARGREDEIRRMVAFVRRLPGMTPDEYRRLTNGAADLGGSTRFEGCAMCHGADGRGRGQPDIPVLGGQNAGYLLAGLRAFHGGSRQSAVMNNAAARLTEADMRLLSGRYAAMPGLGGSAVSPDGEAERIVRAGLPERQLPACASCHAPGKPYPVLAGQKAVYVAGRLRNWRGDENVVDARKSQAIMPVIARRIPEEMIDRLARHYEAAGRPR